MDQYIGRLLDERYEILEVLGVGGMAVVYKARCHRLNRLVAIKILKDEFAGDEEFRRRFRAEGEAVAMLSHPNIVQVYDVSTSGSANYIVMELIDGISLKQYMEKKGVLNWKETLHFAMQIARGLEHAHSRGIVHRDIKPHNVMVLKNGSVKVMDFGIARVMNKSNTLTKEALGSVHYISPEQAKGGQTDSRSDLYSLGVVMYEMMTGRPPYDGESAVAVAIKHINGGAPRPSELNPNIPKGIEQIILKAMALDLRDRYSSATEMLADMEEFRKNPNIVFQHHYLTDDATRIIHTDTLPEVTAARPTTAQRKVKAQTGEGPDAADYARYRREERRRDKEKAKQQKEQKKEAKQAEQPVRLKEPDGEHEGRAATTAVVVCSSVAVIAIVVFLVALFNGALLNQEKDLVEVPYLQGQLYSDTLDTRYGSDFNIRLNPQEYSDTYSNGQIITQQPAGGTEVQRGSDLWLTVSMGTEPPTAEMDNFVGALEADTTTLLEEQGYKPLKKYEASSVYESGVVIRTDPAAGEDVQQGQTVYIYVSSGPAVVAQTMPDVVGLSLSRAKELLESLGFTNVRYEVTESQKAIDEVVYQSVAKDTSLDVGAEIIIQYSGGLENPEVVETTAETAAVQPTEEQNVFTVSFTVPERSVEYRLEVCLEGQTEILASKLVPPNTSSTYLELTGSGTMRFDLYIDGEYYTTTEKVFTNG